jgi:hypothetical protein
MPPPLRTRRDRRFDAPAAIADTTFLTVMLDVTANLLCTAVILLVLSLARDHGKSPPVVEAASAVESQPLSPQELVLAFQARTATTDGVITVDIGKDVVTVKRSGEPPDLAMSVSRADLLAGKFAPLLAHRKPMPVLLFVFDQELYHDVQTEIAKAGLSSREIDAPLALRSAVDPQSWSPAFQALYGLNLDPRSFQQRLQEILRGGGGAGALRDAQSSAGGPSYSMLGLGDGLRRLLHSLGFLWRLTLIVAALAFMVWMKRRHRC